MKQGPNDKFRQAALKHYLKPHHLDQWIPLVSPKAWLIHFALLSLLIGALCWGVWGVIPTRVMGKGILLAGGGNLYNAEVVGQGGRVVKIFVHVGDHVNKGDHIAKLENPELEQKVIIQAQHVKKLEDRYATLQKEHETAITQRRQQLNEQTEILQRMLAADKKNLAGLDNFLKLKRQSVERGLEIRQSLEDSYRDYYRIQNQIEATQDKLVQNRIQMEQFLQDKAAESRQLELKIVEEKSKLNTLESEVITAKTIRSPMTGTVIDVHAAVGSVVKAGTALVSIADAGHGLDALIFMQPREGKRVDVGMKAFVSPTTVEKAEFGSIHGKVLSVAQFPATPQAIQALLQNEGLRKDFSEEATPVIVRVRLEQDKMTHSGFAWSSSAGPKQQITAGTLSDAMITVREQAPVTLIIPAFKKLMGIN